MGMKTGIARQLKPPFKAEKETFVQFDESMKQACKELEYTLTDDWAADF